MMGKKSVRGTLFFSILLQWEKRVGGTLSDFHRTEGEKEFSPLFLPIRKVGKKSGVHCFSPSIRWGKRMGVHCFSLSVRPIKHETWHCFSQNWLIHLPLPFAILDTLIDCEFPFSHCSTLPCICDGHELRFLLPFVIL